MNIKLYHIILLALLLLAGHATALRVGLYQGTVWVDMPLHFLGGAFLGISWLWILAKAKGKMGEPSDFFVGISIVGFSLFGSFVWELFEYGLLVFFTGFSESFKLYSRSVSDAFSDMALGLLGGVVAALIHSYRNKRITQFPKYK